MSDASGGDGQNLKVRRELQAGIGKWPEVIDPVAVTSQMNRVDLFFGPIVGDRSHRGRRDHEPATLSPTLSGT